MRIFQPSTDADRFLVFPSELGWMAVAMAGDAAGRLTFGHRSQAAAIDAIISSFSALLPRSAWEHTASNAPRPLHSGQCLVYAVRSHAERGNETMRSVRAARSHTERGNEELVTRLQRYAAGNPDAFCDISVDFGQASEFRRRVLNLCRRIPFGRTVSYAELAARAGSPRAARAVGNCMAANPIPLLIPCHRVICADSRIGVYSAPGGTAMKQRLLAMEQREGVAIPHN